MNELKKKLAMLLAVCLVMTNVLPVFAEPVYEPLATEDQYTETEEMEEATPADAGYADLTELEDDLDALIPG